MALVSQDPEVIEIPHEEGCAFGLIRLNHTQLAEARRKADSKNRQQMRELGGEIFAAITKKDDEDEDGERAAERTRQVLARLEYDPASFDRATVLRYGLRSWEGGDYDSIKLSPKKVELLDEPTAKWAHDLIINMSKPESAEEGNAS